MQWSLALFCLLTLWKSDLSPEAAWSYTSPDTGPANWAKTYPNCGSNTQSPVNLANPTYNADLLPAKLFVNDTIELNNTPFQMTNVGHTVKISFPRDVFYLSFSAKDKQPDFVVAEMLFHWGKVNDRGSEHTIDGKSFPMECQLLAYNSTYHNLTEATKSTRGLASLSFLFHYKEKLSEGEKSLTHILGKYITELTSLFVPTSFHRYPGIDVTQILTLLKSNNYYQYAGSLTTPGCNENVMWTVFDDTIPVTAIELRLLRLLFYQSSEKEKFMVDNFRPIQPLNSRQLLTTIQPTTTSQSTKTNQPTTTNSISITDSSCGKSLAPFLLLFLVSRVFLSF